MHESNVLNQILPDKNRKNIEQKISKHRQKYILTLQRWSPMNKSFFLIIKASKKTIQVEKLFQNKCMYPKTMTSSRACLMRQKTEAVAERIDGAVGFRSI